MGYFIQRKGYFTNKSTDFFNEIIFARITQE